MLCLLILSVEEHVVRPSFHPSILLTACRMLGLFLKAQKPHHGQVASPSREQRVLAKRTIKPQRSLCIAHPAHSHKKLTPGEILYLHFSCPACVWNVGETLSKTTPGEHRMALPPTRDLL